MKTIVITGDIVVDHHIYEGERPTPAVMGKRGVCTKPEYGGARCAEKILKAVLELAPALHREKATKQAPRKRVPPVPEESWKVLCGLDLPDEPPPGQPGPCGHDAYAVWRPFDEKRHSDDKKQKKFWRASAAMGYGGEGDPSCPVKPPSPKSGLPQPRILVLDDAGYAFRSRLHKKCWLLPPSSGPVPDWIILKTSHPVAQGDLWREVTRERPRKMTTERFVDRLIVIVSAQDMRRECARLSQGLSWEGAVEDLRDELQRNYAVTNLTRCRHLLIDFGADGVLWLDRDPEGPRATLIYDAAGCEGDWAAQFDGQAFGYLSCLVAAVARELIHYSARRAKTAARRKEQKPPPPPDLGAAAAAGLAAIRRLRRDGHGEVGPTGPSGFPAAGLAKEILDPTEECVPKGGFARSRLPWLSPVDVSDRERWMIVDSMQRTVSHAEPRPLFGLARRVVLEGTAALKDFPHAQFGLLTTADRSEIETLRGLRHLMQSYARAPGADRPLSIGVFGPPGAGKSFGVKQIAHEVFGKEAWVEFNLSQFNDTVDLMGAFHRVRDLVLAGKTPVAFWDEFDSKQHHWLQYLLAPMQDGRFQEGNLTHASGKCVFIFAGGTSHTYDEFGHEPDEPKAKAEFKLRKVPDFHSRLDGYYDVLGPNPRLIDDDPDKPDPADLSYPLRRALFIRLKLDAKDALLDFDPGLLNALLETGRYTHGARSLEKLALALRPAAPGMAIRRSALPPPGQLAMHVDANDFQALLARDSLFQTEENLNILAEAIHEAWRAISRREGWTMQYDMPFSELPAEIQDDNRAAAARIPEILALAGLRLANGKVTPAQEKEVGEHLEHHLELLAEAEHVGWMAQKLKNGWRFAPERNDDRKQHHALVPYAQLAKKDAGKDRDSVRHFPEMARLAKFHIEFITGPRVPAPAST